MNGIFYFSSTGNSLYLAKKIQSELNGNVIYIPNYKGNGSKYDRIIIVSPVYSFGLPVHTYDFLLNINEKSKIYVVLNYGGMAGGADVLTYNLATEHNKNICGVYKLKMPENYTLTFTPPSIYSKLVLKNSHKKIAKIIAELKQDKVKIPKNSKTYENTYYKNKSNWHLIGNSFSVSDKCVKCKKCINICPVNNITMVNNKIQFGDNCVSCLGCYHRCPEKAIKYKNRNKKSRYLNPYVTDKEIGSDF